VRREDRSVLEPWADLWYYYMAGTFLKSYLNVAYEAESLIPTSREEVELMLNAFLLDKAVYELGYELNNRPDWVMIPMRGIKHILAGE
jgi:maltose alpha-D-glucosyltransferase / alpha-amylase